MSITRIKLTNFTAFKHIDLEFSDGMNILIGANGTGKTHIMKVIYSACDITKTHKSFLEKLVNVFLPSKRRLGRLVRRQGKSSRCSIELTSDRSKIRASFSNHTSAVTSSSVSFKVIGEESWKKNTIETVYIPPKEVLSNAPGLLSLYSQREIHIEEIYIDILRKSYLPSKRGPKPDIIKKILKHLQEIVDGKVIIEDDEFFFRRGGRKLEFSLLAEGTRKLALLWILINNGSLNKGSVLFWDEPEANLNPKLIGLVVEILLELQRMGVQIFIATHNYVVLKEIELRKKNGDNISFFSFYKSHETGDVLCHVSHDYCGIHPNAIAETYSDIYDREVRRIVNML